MHAGIVCFQDSETKYVHDQSYSENYGSHLRRLRRYLELSMLDVNARCADGNTMLHLAAKEANLKAIKLFLNNGADSNIRNNAEETPLFLIFSSKASNERKRECVESLLLHGADYDLLNLENETIVNVALKNGSFFSLQPIVAHIVRLRELDSAVNERILDQIKFVRVLRHYYRSCVNHLEEMKYTKIDKEENVTEYQVLVEDEEKIAAHMHNSNVRRKFEEHEVTSDLYYNSLFKFQIRKAMEIQKLRSDASLMLRKSIKFFAYCSHIIVDKIICYLNHNDLNTLKEIMEHDEKKV